MVDEIVVAHPFTRYSPCGFPSLGPPAGFAAGIFDSSAERAAYWSPADQGPVVRQLFSNKSLHYQLVLVAFSCVLATAGVATVVAFVSTAGNADADSAVLRWRLLAAVAVMGAASLIVLYVVIRRLLRPLHRLRDLMSQVSKGDYAVAAGQPIPDVFGLARTFDKMIAQLQQSRADQERAAAGLATRTRTVDRLLEFSQGIQAAGNPEQVLATLTHFMQAELGLSGMALLSVEPEAVPTTTVRGCCPADLLKSNASDMDPALCPCLRQHLPRHFRGDGSPVRCGIDASLNVGTDHPAYCIPFTIGGKTQSVAHMLLPPGRDWDDNLKQLAQTYLNTAQGTLVGLHLLAEAERTSMTDSLTGLYNRRSLDSLMLREVALAERHGQTLSLVMIDMDHFKEVNDAHGHAAGDHLLRSFADSVRATLRRTDLAFRYGGDEFVIALPQTTVAQAQQVVQKLRQAFANIDFRDAIHGLKEQPTLSVGVAERSIEAGVLQWSALLAAADAALYEAKTASRNCVRVYHASRAA
jgi:diguanylate cyclase (GGDEF)-like protein